MNDFSVCDGIRIAPHGEGVAGSAVGGGSGSVGGGSVGAWVGIGSGVLVGCGSGMSVGWGWSVGFSVGAGLVGLRCVGISVGVLKVRMGVTVGVRVLVGVLVSVGVGVTGSSEQWPGPRPPTLYSKRVWMNRIACSRSAVEIAIPVE